MNYIESGLYQIKGQSVLYNDLETRLIIDEKGARNDYENAKPWLKNYAYADGINYYLQNPAVQPVLLLRALVSAAVDRRYRRH
jgi:acyl-homoserine lactone acylase PvdQ